MKKKIIAFGLSFFLVGSAVLANNFKLNMNGFHFIAPAVNGKANVYQPAVGEIVYDSSDAGFWGYDQTGSWVSLGGSASGGNTPTGSLLPFAGSVAPAGYLIADGSAVSRSAYAALFSIIGTTYGNGDGSTTFNLPDTRNVFLRGANNAARTIGGTTYSAVALGVTSLDTLQGHYHGISGSSLSSFYGYKPSGGTFALPAAGTSVGETTTIGAPRTDGTNGTPRTGSETAPVNLGVNFIIKY